MHFNLCGDSCKAVRDFGVDRANAGCDFQAPATLDTQQEMQCQDQCLEEGYACEASQATGGSNQVILQCQYLVFSICVLTECVYRCSLVSTLAVFVPNWVLPSVSSR